MRKLREIWSRVRSPFFEFGPFAGSLYALDRMLQLVSPHLRLHSYELLAQPTAETSLLPSRYLNLFSIREVNKADPVLGRMPIRPEVRQSRCEQNCVCLGAYRASELVAYMWLAFGQYQEDEVRCTFELVRPEESVFDFDFYIWPEHRMGLAFLALWNGANEFLRSRGVCWSYSRLTRTNIASRNAHLRLGARRIASAFFFYAWGVEVMFATVVPYMAITGPGKRVRLRLFCKEERAQAALKPLENQAE